MGETLSTNNMSSLKQSQLPVVGSADVLMARPDQEPFKTY